MTKRDPYEEAINFSDMMEDAGELARMSQEVLNEWHKKGKGYFEGDGRLKDVEWAGAEMDKILQQITGDEDRVARAGFALIAIMGAFALSVGHGKLGKKVACTALCLGIQHYVGFQIDRMEEGDE